MGELAGKFHCSSRHLNRLFHKHFGFSVAALRMEMRLIKAITLLRNRDAKVIHVAEECGFNHLGLFNSCFKHRFGTSPGRWRDANVPAHAQPPGLIRGRLPLPDASRRSVSLGRQALQRATRQPKTRPPKPLPAPGSPLALQPARRPNAGTRRWRLPAAQSRGPLAAMRSGSCIARKLEAAVRTRLNTASCSTIGERQRFVNGAPTPSKTLA